MCSDEAAMASIKVFDPVSVPRSVLEELQQLRAQVERLRQENERLRQENERLQRELEEARASLDQAQRQSKRQAAPFSKGPPKPQPKKPGRKSGTAHGRHGHRLPPSPAAVYEILEAPLPDACPQCGGSVRETEVATQYQTEIPRRPLIRQFNIHVGCCWGGGQEVRLEIKSAPCLTPDETGWRVAGRPAWLHAWVAERATCYAIDPHRKADVLERLIGIDWSGTMVHDGFASYDRFEAATHQQCLGHVLRRVRELEAKATRGAVHYPRKLIALFTAAIHLRNQHHKGQVSAEQLAQARKEFDWQLRQLAWPAREGPAYETVSAYLWKPLDEWFPFLSHPEVGPTHREAEQAIRPAVVNRKVWGGNRTWAGARAQEVLMSVLETCRRAGRPGLEFVSRTLRAFANPLLPRPILLTPR